MTTNLPSTIHAVQWSAKSSGGLAQELTFKSEVPLPLNASALPKDATLAKVAYVSLNHIDYKLSEAPFINTRMFSTPKVPGRDFAGIVVSSTIPGFEAGNSVCGKSDPPVFGTMAEYFVIEGTEGIVKVPDNVAWNKQPV